MSDRCSPGGLLFGRDEVLAHISPVHSENVNPFGTITVDIDSELAKLDTSGYRQLRAQPRDA